MRVPTSNQPQSQQPPSETALLIALGHMKQSGRLAAMTEKDQPQPTDKQPLPTGQLMIDDPASMSRQLYRSGVESGSRDVDMKREHQINRRFRPEVP